MKTFSKSLVFTVAALSVTAATALLNAQTNGLTGKVPMDFVINGKTAAAGTYQVVEQRPGMVAVRNDHGQYIALAVLPVKTGDNAKRSKLTFLHTNGEYRLIGFCTAGRSCWSNPDPANNSSKTMDVALSMAR